MRARNTAVDPIMFQDIEANFPGTSLSPHGYTDEAPDRVQTTFDFGLGPFLCQVIVDPNAPDGVRVEIPRRELRFQTEDADDHVRAMLGLALQPRSEADNDNNKSERSSTDSSGKKTTDDGNGKKTAQPLPVIDPSTWQGVPVNERKWFVPGLIPCRTVTLLSGDGGTGKSQLALQLIAASALRTEWLGLPVMDGPCLFYTAEDEADELHQRLVSIVRHYGRQLSDLTGVRLIPMVDRDSVLGMPNRLGRIVMTPAFESLIQEAVAVRPKLIVLDTSADVFGGDEIKRVQVRQFITMLRELALSLDCAVLLLSHPSLSGMATGRGTSGSTAWSNSVRSRLYLTAGSEDDTDSRVLRLEKSNYGPTGGKIALRWRDGVYALDGEPDTAAASLIHAKVDALFLELLAMFAAQDQDLSAKPSSTYAPTMMARHPKAKGFTKRQLEAAMQRLLEAKRIRIVTEGPPSKQRKRVAVGPSMSARAAAKARAAA